MPAPLPAVARLALLVPALLGTGCMTRPRMCAAEADCTGQASCVAGRCVARGATAAIDTARRLVFAPVDVAYVRPSSSAAAEGIAALGRASEQSAFVLMRFSAALPDEATVLEAYVVLERPAGVDIDPSPIALHAARIVEAWDSRSVSWVRPPRLEEVGAPVTRVFPASGPLIRLDVRPLVQGWRRRTGRDFGISVLADGSSATGIVVALARQSGGEYDPVLASVSAPPAASVEGRGGASSPRVAHAGGEVGGPRLEIYVR